MPAIFKTNNPLLYTQLDGVIVTELSPPLGVVNAGANNAVFLGQFERGTSERAVLVASIAELETLFGSNPNFSGSKALRSKGFTNLYVVRVVSSSAVKASLTLQTSANQDIITFTARDFGAYGNGITIEVIAGSTANTWSVNVSDGVETETYTDISVANKDTAEINAIFGSSKLITASGVSINELEAQAKTPLANGDDGQVAPSDYTDALTNANVNVAGKIYFADSQVSAVNTALSNHVKTEQDGICVIGAESNAINVADAISDYANYADPDGRVIYAYNHVGYLNELGDVEFESPVYTLASLISLTPPHVAVNSASNASFTRHAVAVNQDLLRGSNIQLTNAGIQAFENDDQLGVRIVSPVTSNPNITLLRRRMSDFILSTISRFLKQYQGEPNSVETRSAIRGAIQDWYKVQVRNGVLPSDDELESGKAFLVETEGLTTDLEKAQGIVKIKLQVRLFASARFIVLIATIGENVVVEEQGA